MREPLFGERVAAATAHLAEVDPILAKVIARTGACDIVPHSNYFQALAGSIIGQQLSVKAAATIRGRFEALGDESFPTPEQTIAFSVEELRAVGLSRAKVAYVQDLAQHVIDRRLDVDRLPELSNEEIVVEVTDIKGIGEWTAQMFLMFCLGRLDVLPTGDLGIRKGMQVLYDLAELPKPVEMVALAERNGWGGYESVASWYVWEALDMKVAI